MGYKRADNNMTFAEMSLLHSMENNRSLQRLEKIIQIIDWSEIQKILADNYTVGTSREGADAYSPMVSDHRVPIINHGQTRRYQVLVP